MAKDKPAFILGLLSLDAAHFRAVDVLKQIPPQLDVPGLKAAVQKSLHLSSTQVILVKDRYHYLTGTNRFSKAISGLHLSIYMRQTRVESNCKKLLSATHAAQSYLQRVLKGHS